MAITVQPSFCPQNHRCPAVRHCPVGALSQEGFAAPAADESQCIDCGRCVRVCPMGALQAQAVRPAGECRRPGGLQGYTPASHSRG